jgi:hypothetical protein
MSQKSNREFPLLEAKDGVVRVANNNHVTGGASLPPLVHPLIIDMTEVNVRQERPDDRALEHACRQPFCDQPNNSPAANPMFDERTSQFWSTLSNSTPSLSYAAQYLACALPVNALRLPSRTTRASLGAGTFATPSG